MIKIHIPTKPICIHLKVGTEQKRLWFEVKATPEAENKFSKIATQIDSIVSDDMKELIEKVTALFSQYGIDRIAR